MDSVAFAVIPTSILILQEDAKIKIVASKITKELLGTLRY